MIVQARLGIVLGCLLALAPSTAVADDASRVAMDHFHRGTRAYDLGHFTEAAAEYEKAYEAKENPALLYNLGQAYRGAGEHQKALNAYRAYLRNAPDAGNRDEVAHFIEALKHSIEVEKAAKEKPPVGTLPAPPPPATAPPVTAPIVVAPPPPRREPDQHELALGRKLRIAGIAVGAFGVASVATGAAFAGLTAKTNDELNHPSGTMPTYDKSLESKGRTYQALETAFFVVGGAAVVAGVATFLVGTQKVKRNNFALAPIVAPTQVGASFGLSF
jgi:tetratricopeptide (TPR) repeat protein